MGFEGEIDNRDVDGWDSEGHTGEYSVEFGDDESDSFGGSGGGRDDISDTRSSKSSFGLFGDIDGGLRSGASVSGGHESFSDSPVLVDDVGNWGEAVSGARSVGNDSHAWVIEFVVDSDDESGGSFVLGGGGEDNVPGSSV